MAIKILVVDDSAFMRSMLSRMISKDSRFEVVGQAKNGQEAVEMNASLKPDVITLDIEMPVMDGLTALKRIMKEAPTKVVMVSSLTTEGAESTLEALDYGAVDFIPKSMDGSGQNILHASALISEKLLAAAGVSVERTASPRPSSPAPTATRSSNTSSFRRPSLVEKALSRQQSATVEPEKPVAKRNLVLSRLPSAKLVVLGSSTGGPRALQELLPHLPSGLRVPVVIAQHMPATFTGAMAQRLDAASMMKVVEATDGDVLEPGTVYIAPGGMHTRVVEKGGKMVIDVREDQGGESVYKPSVDILAESASSIVGAHVLAVMLTGMGVDGSKGFASLKQKGSYVLAQDEGSSVVYGMPKAVAPIADQVLPLTDIAEAMKKLLS